ncbi:MAG: rhomboid family intramembrane serine protease [Roseibacillus sp.]
MQFRPKRLRFPRPGWNFHTLVPLSLLLIFLPFQFSGGAEGPLQEWYQVLGLSRGGFFQKGHFWELFTHPLLHGNLTHWLTNAFFLYYFGGRIHDIFGEREVWRTATWATLGGGLLHLLFQGGSPLIGASGAGMGLFIALTTVSPESKMFPLPIRARNLRNGIIAGTVLLLLMIPGLGIPVFGNLGEAIAMRGGESLFQIGHACHLGGAIVGVLAMRKYFRKPITLAQLKRERAAREENDNEAA